jgi:SAM-dependent methyltransferase
MVESSTEMALRGHGAHFAGLGGRRGVPVREATAAYQGYPPSDPEVVRQDLHGVVAVAPYRIDITAFLRYLEEAPYPDSYRRDFGELFIEKALEHWVSLHLIAPITNDGILIDVASCSSPFPDIVEARHNISAYRQDLSYPDGVNGKTVGGSAERLPFAEASISAMTLHCSLEHFERDADINFIREAERVLRPGGMLCILPLYLAEVFHNLTDPDVERTGLVFDAEAAIAEVPGWRNRFGRFYDIPRFSERVLANARDFL